MGDDLGGSVDDAHHDLGRMVEGQPAGEALDRDMIAARSGRQELGLIDPRRPPSGPAAATARSARTGRPSPGRRRGRRPAGASPDR